MEGETFENTCHNLRRVIFEICSRGGIPFIISDSGEQFSYTCNGLLDYSIENQAQTNVVNVSANIDLSLLTEPRFCRVEKSNTKNPSRRTCDRRFVHFATQVTPFYEFILCILIVVV